MNRVKAALTAHSGRGALPPREPEAVWPAS
jgi:hypothetical protein